jgi:hypothetical protein
LEQYFGLYQWNNCLADFSVVAEFAITAADGKVYQLTGCSNGNREESRLGLKSIFGIFQKQGCRLTENPVLLPRHYMTCFTRRR